MNLQTSLFRHSAILAPIMAMACALALPTASAETEDNIRKSFTVQSGGKLVVDADRGSIDVKSAKGSRVEVEVLRKVTGASDAKSQEILDENKVSFDQAGDTVTVRAKGKNDGFKFWRTDRYRFQVRYVISVPEKFNADLKTAGGGITVADLAGEVKARSSGGGLKFGNLQGPVDGHTSGGSISVAGCKGTVKIETSGGGINIGEGEGNLTAKTSGGSIHIKSYRGDIYARTSGGGITSEQIHGNLDASTSGGSISAVLYEQPSGDCRLATSGGSITVKLGESVAADVNAETSGGSVHTELPVTIVGEKKRNALKGKLNGGGKALELHTSGGSIHLKKL